MEDERGKVVNLEVWFWIVLVLVLIVQHQSRGADV